MWCGWGPRPIHSFSIQIAGGGCVRRCCQQRPLPQSRFLSLPVLQLSLDYWTHPLTPFPGQAAPQAFLASSATWTPSIHHETWFKNLKIPRGEAKGVLDSAFLGVSWNIVSTLCMLCYGNQWSLMLLLQKDYDSLKAQMIVNFFLAIKYFKLWYACCFFRYKHYVLLTHLIDYTIV